ncbi:sigma 54-interacting transcriptional regulator [Metabacillus malikii]|uniref:PAS domain S-box-containing protein n=1 Tax=Metabacillus malikii TaxID=1504265 RepID=A0ABT9ZJC3_9BACI|nr:sigma 54-interacting transcriptional regulator [Metabacillus malikii]MDQ0231907.1 PAS domain S-box-containing protein [Metabacillus malikii]
MQNVLIIGAKEEGVAFLHAISKINGMKIVAIIEKDKTAIGINDALQMNIPTYNSWDECKNKNIHIIYDTTGDTEALKQDLTVKTNNITVIPYQHSSIWATICSGFIESLANLNLEADMLNLIFNTCHDGFIVVDRDENITFINECAQHLIGMLTKSVIGIKVSEVIPTSRITDILKSREMKVNQEIELANKTKVITTYLPLIDKSGILHGVLMILREYSDVLKLANEVTNIKGFQMMLASIIQSSDESLSVVDEEGRYLYMNQAFANLTGLSKDLIIGKKINGNRSELEMLHLKTLTTRRPIREVVIQIENTKEVKATYDPIIVDGKLVGSVGVVKDVSEIVNIKSGLNRARQIIRNLEGKYSFEDIIGKHEQLKVAIHQAKFGAKTPVTILLRGNTGTGKNLFAQAIHSASERKYNKFIRVNCSELRDIEAEKQLFGCVNGEKGLLEEADNGTVYFDEIGILTMEMQRKLLDLISTHQIARGKVINVRVIAATMINIEKAMADGTFLEELYYQLNRYSISLPSLKERSEDISLLCEKYLNKHNYDFGRNIKEITSDALQILKEYDWPGNIRELDNILARTIMMMEPNAITIDAHHLRLPKALDVSIQPNSDIGYKEETLAETVERVEKDVIKQSLEKYRYNRTKTAKALGISLRNLYYKIEKYNLANNSKF